MKVRMSHRPFRAFETCLSLNENCFSALFAFLLLGTCSHFHCAGPKFTALIGITVMKTVSLSRLFDIDLNSDGSGLSQTNTHISFCPSQYRKKQLQERVGPLRQKWNCKEIYAISMFTNTWNTQKQDECHHLHYQNMSFTFNSFHASEGLSTKPQVIAECFMVGSILYGHCVYVLSTVNVLYH